MLDGFSSGIRKRSKTEANHSAIALWSPDSDSNSILTLQSLPHCLYEIRLFLYFQHHETVRQYNTTLETLLFTSDIDFHILTVFNEFQALRG